MSSLGPPPALDLQDGNKIMFVSWFDHGASDRNLVLETPLSLGDSDKLGSPFEMDLYVKL